MRVRALATAATAAFVLCLLVPAAAAAPPPNIVFIMCDDLGFNDISLHGSAQIPTPNIDAIAASGTHLARYYAQPVCSPTRASLMTGRHVIHTGIYMPFNHGITNDHLDTRFTLLPQYLKKAANYTAHMVGKVRAQSRATKASSCTPLFNPNPRPLLMYFLCLVCSGTSAATPWA